MIWAIVCLKVISLRAHSLRTHGKMDIMKIFMEKIVRFVSKVTIAKKVNVLKPVLKENTEIKITNAKNVLKTVLCVQDLLLNNVNST